MGADNEREHSAKKNSVERDLQNDAELALEGLVPVEPAIEPEKNFTINHKSLVESMLDACIQCMAYAGRRTQLF